MDGRRLSLGGFSTRRRVIGRGSNRRLILWAVIAGMLGTTQPMRLLRLGAVDTSESTDLARAGLVPGPGSFAASRRTGGAILLTVAGRSCLKPPLHWIILPFSVTTWSSRSQSPTSGLFPARPSSIQNEWWRGGGLVQRRVPDINIVSRKSTY